jgi:hypothetical protein
MTARLRTELNKNAEDLIYHNLKSLLNKAITETNAQFDTNDILSRLDIRILIVSVPGGQPSPDCYLTAFTFDLSRRFHPVTKVRFLMTGFCSLMIRPIAKQDN